MGGESSKEKQFFTTKKGIKVKKMVVNPSDPVEEIESDTEKDYVLKVSARSRKSKMASGKESIKSGETNKMDVNNTRPFQTNMMQANAFKPPPLMPPAGQPMMDPAKMRENPNFAGHFNTEQRNYVNVPIQAQPMPNMANFGNPQIPNQILMPKRLPPLDFQKLQTVNNGHNVVNMPNFAPIQRPNPVIVLSPRRF